MVESICYIVVAIVISGLIAWPIASAQNRTIDNCLKSQRMSEDILTGQLQVGSLSDTQLIALLRPKFTVVGVGGAGPRYIPSFFVWDEIHKELARRRSKVA